MQHWLYLAALCLSLTGLAVIDHRFRLAYFYDAMRTIKAVAASVTVFVLWDLLGIGLGIFYVGNSPYLTGIRLAPEFPIEELFFLTLLVYSALLLLRGGEKLWPRT